MSQIVSIIQKQDVRCFYTLNQKFHNRVLDELMKLITELGTTVFSIFVTLILFAFDRWSGIVLGINLLVSQLVIHIIKRVVNRPRPYKTFDWVIAINPPKCKYSLPSGHSGSALTIALVLAQFFPIIAIPVLLLALLVGISRSYLGVHYPTDVILGFSIAFVAYKLLELLAFSTFN